MTPINKLSSLYRKFYAFLKQDRKLLILNFGVMTLSIITGAILIWMIGQGVNSLINNNLNSMIAYLIAFCTLILALQGLRYLNHYLHELLQQRVIFKVRRTLFSHILDLSTPFTNTQSTGDLLTRLGRDVLRISQMLVLLPSNLFGFTLTSIFYIAILFFIDPVLTLLSLLLAPLFLIHQRLFLKKTRKTARQYLYYEGRMGGFEEESLNNVEGIASFNAEKTMLKQFQNLFSKYRRAAMANLMLNNLFIVTFELLAAFLAVTILTAGIYRVSSSYLNTGDLINFLLYLGYLIVPMRGLARLPVEFQTNAAAAERIAVILDERPTVTSKAHALILQSACKNIIFSEVDFSYDKKRKVVSDLSLNIRPYEFIAITGPSGVGKSTIAKLLLRFYDPCAGNILWDNINLKDLDLQSLRSRIAIVWQNNFIIDGTVTENIRLGNPDASALDIIKAADAANASRFIKQLPDGYNTRLGGNGNRLSAGQKQRIALAQAFIKKAPLLILDEATSSLDSDSERLILQAIKNMKNKCTTIVIAHRYSTIAAADRVVYINDDMSVTIGTHNELSNTCKPYRNIIKHQLQTSSPVG